MFRINVAHVSIACCIGLPGVAALAGPPAATGSAPASMPAGRAEPTTGVHVICLARSADGLVFRETGRMFAVGASAPAVTTLKDGELLALFVDESRSLGRSTRVARTSTGDARSSRAGATAAPPGRLMAARSSDDGRTWTSPRPVTLRDSAGHEAAVSRGCLLREPRGAVRMYFVEDRASAGQPPKTDAAAGGSAAGASRQTREADARSVVRSATTRDGVEFLLEETRLEAPDVQQPFLSVATLGAQTHLFLGSDGDRPLRCDGREAAALHFVSTDGRRFVPAEPVVQPGARFAGDVETFDRLMRAYVGAADGIASLISMDGRHWRADAGYRIGRGFQPAVTRLRDGSCLMLYTVSMNPQVALRGPRHRHVGGEDGAAAGVEGSKTPSRADGGAPPAGDAAARDGSGQPGRSEPGSPGRPAGEGTSIDESAPAGTPPLIDLESGEQAGAGETSGNGAASEAQKEWSAFADGPPGQPAGEGEAAGEGKSAAPGKESAAGDSASGDSAAAQAGAECGAAQGKTAGEANRSGDQAERPVADNANGSAPMEYDPSDPFPPKPDFRRPVDYGAWYEARCAKMVDDNAFDLYSAFMPSPNNPPGNPAEWPEFRDMFNDANPDFPTPWDPAQHPEWEQSRAATADIMNAFTEASRHAGFARHIELMTPDKDLPDEARPLLMMLLPDLSYHRRATKRALADGWRMENGQVSPENMIESWRTGLGNARHLHQGTTLIEHLVGTAEQALVEKNARSALQQNVFKTPEAMEQALATLVEQDRDDADPGLWLTGEHAFMMDSVQYLFRPTKPGEPPRVDEKRLKFMAGIGLGDEQSLEKIRQMTADDARRTVDAMDQYFREAATLMRTGRPTVRAADIDALTEKYLHVSPLTGTFMPSISRVYMLRTRNEASRRATQLSYAVHIFKARQGRWPASLDELPADYSRMTTDPFTGGRFGYRVGPNGPTIYSASENGRDDGGVHAPRWGDEGNGESDDYVFWPPQPR